ncbi:MAG: RNA polymerase sigma-70 factor (family 1) [Crocinitomicaceae bacterium]
MTKDQFKHCFDQYFDQLRNYIYYRCGDEERASDIAQESFMKIWEKDIDFDENKVKGLLYHIAKQLWISQYRKKESEKKYELSLTFKPSSDNPDETLEYQELKNNYEETLAALPAKQREVFLMSRIDDLTYKEIAIRLEISVKAIEKRMSLALQELRKVLSNET